MAMDTGFPTPFRLTSQIAEADRAAATTRQPSLNETKARETADSFEAHFLSTFVESMFSGIKSDGPFGGGQGETVFRSMLNQEYGAAMSRSGGVGISDAVFNEILKIQEASQ